jgi:hypothetical protein
VDLPWSRPVYRAEFWYWVPSTADSMVTSSYFCLSELSNEHLFYTGRDNSVLDCPGSSCGRTTFFSYSYCLDRLWGPPSILFNKYRSNSPRVKRQERETIHPPPCIAKVKKGVAPLLMTSMQEVQLIEHRYNFIYLHFFYCGCMTCDQGVICEEEI